MRKLKTEEIKKYELDILKYINDFCKKNNIEYFLAYGTLIGAIRHRGFIPWDDDIDIVIKRKDYERFRKLFTDTENYKILDIENNEDYYYPFVKIVDTRTKVIEKDFKDIDDLGVWVDVFPLDNYSSRYTNKNKIEILKKKLLVSRSKTFLKSKNKIKNVFKFGAYCLMKNKNPRKYGIEINNEGKKVSVSGSHLCVMFTPNISKNIFETEWYKKSIEWEFEGNKFSIPKEYDKILSSYYGDYMKLPAEENRVSGHNIDAYEK